MRYKAILTRIFIATAIILISLSCIKRERENKIPLLVIGNFNHSLDEAMALSWLAGSDIIHTAGIIIPYTADTVKRDEIKESLNSLNLKTVIISDNSRIDSIFFAHSTSLRILLLAPPSLLLDYLDNYPEQIGRIHSIYIQNCTSVNLLNDSLLSITDIIPKFFTDKSASKELPILKSDLDYIVRHSIRGKYLQQIAESVDTSYILTYPHALLTAVSVEKPHFFHLHESIFQSIKNHAQLKRTIVNRL